MAKIQDREKDEISFKYEPPIYSKEELKQFEKDLEPYIVERHGKKYLDVEGQNKFLIDQKAISKYGGIYVTGLCIKKTRNNEDYTSCDYPSLYEVLSDKIEQLINSKRKQEYAEKSVMKEVELLTNNFKINDL